MGAFRWVEGPGFTQDLHSDVCTELCSGRCWLRMRVWRKTVRKYRPPRRGRRGGFSAKPFASRISWGARKGNSIHRESFLSDTALPSSVASASEANAGAGETRKVLPKPQAFGSCRDQVLVSLAAAIALNVFIAVLLLLVKQSVTVRASPPLLVSAIVEHRPEDSQRETLQRKTRTNVESSASAASASALSSPDLSLETVSSMSLSSFALPESTGLGGMSGGGFSTGTEIGFGKSAGLSGNGYGDVVAAFGNAGLGDGSGLIVVRDVSGSMRKHNEVVDELLNRDYPKAKLHSVVGCAIEFESPFVIEIRKITRSRKNKRRTIFFLCDLQDKESRFGVEALSKHLFSSDPPYVLHVISFEKSPIINFQSLIEASGGTLTIADHPGKDLRVRQKNPAWGSGKRSYQF